MRDIAVVVYLAPLPVRSDGRIGSPFFAGDIKVRELLHNAPRPFTHEVLVWIRIGIDADASESEILGPPDSILNQVVRKQRVALIQVGHREREPAICKSRLVELGGVDILIACSGVRCDGFLLRDIQPVGARHVVHPPVFTANMVENHVHNQTNAHLTGFFR